MQTRPSNLRDMIVLIYEMEGMVGVKGYARETNIPMKVCLDLLIPYICGQLDAGLVGAEDVPSVRSPSFPINRRRGHENSSQ
jgi:hypothetical protein